MPDPVEQHATTSPPPGATATTTLSRELDRLMGRLRGVATRTAEQLEHRTGRSSTQLATLQSIANGATGVGDVARACLTHVSNASRTVDSLVRDGLVDRSVDPRDRRAVVLELTDAGTACRAQMTQHRDDAVAAAMTDLDVDERRTLVDLLDRFLTGFEHALGMDSQIDTDTDDTDTDPDNGDGDGHEQESATTAA